MATTALTIIKKALRVIGVIDRNQPLSAEDRNYALEAFNDVVLHVQTTYNNLWTMTQAVVLMERGKQFYKCGQGGDRAVLRDDLRTQTTSAATLAGATTITLSGAVTVQDNDTVGILLGSGSFFWTTAASASSGTSVSLTDSLPSDSASGARVYIYTDIIDRPLRVLNAQSAWSITDAEIPLEQFSRQEYFDQPDKTTKGQTSNYYYSPQLTAGELYVWPTAQSNLNVLRMTFIRPIVTMITNIDATDFPDEWQETLVYMLADRLASEYQLPSDKQASIRQRLEESLANSLSFDNSSDSLKVEIGRY